MKINNITSLCCSELLPVWMGHQSSSWTPECRKVLYIFLHLKSWLHLCSVSYIVSYLPCPWLRIIQVINVPQYCLKWAPCAGFLSSSCLPFQFFSFTFGLHLLSCSCHILTHTHSCVGKPRAQGLVDISSFITQKTKRSSKFTLKVSYQTEVVTALWEVVRLMKIPRSQRVFIFTDEYATEMATS